MATKPERHSAIRALVEGEVVASQREMLKALRRKGLAVDQSTLSRDLTELGIEKRGGRYGFAQRSVGPVAIDYTAVVRGFEPCGPHLIVIRTTVGQAQPVAIAIDAADEPSIAGTVAGDDTIFVATRNRRSQVVALRRFEQWFGGNREA